MKISTVGIILLTLMVSVKYFISQQTLTHKDGALQQGLVVDYAIVQEELEQLNTSAPSLPLLAYNSLNTVADQFKKTYRSTNHSQTIIAQVVSTDGYVVNESEESEGPAPVEFASTMVVYNPSNPALAQMDEYLDKDDLSPLDEGNTIVNEMQLMMPRR